MFLVVVKNFEMKNGCKKNKFETLLPASTLNPIFKRRREVDKLDVTQCNVLLPPCVQIRPSFDLFRCEYQEKTDSNKEKFVFITSSSLASSSLANYSTGQAMVTHRGLHISESCPFMKYTVTFSWKIIRQYSLPCCEKWKIIFFDYLRSNDLVHCCVLPLCIPLM